MKKHFSEIIFDFEIHHIPGTQMEQIGPDILSRCMLPQSARPQDILARRLERPVLKLNHNFSPFLHAWFSIENPEPSWFDEESNLIINKGTIGYELPQDDTSKPGANNREDKVYTSLRKMLKQKSEKEGKHAAQAKSSTIRQAHTHEHTHARTHSA